MYFINSTSVKKEAEVIQNIMHKTSDKKKRIIVNRLTEIVYHSGLNRDRSEYLQLHLFYLFHSATL